MSALSRTVGMLALLAAAGCGDALGPEPEDVHFEDELGITLSQMTKLPSGVYVQTTTPGTGTATVAANSLVTIGYRGWLVDGTLFDSNPNFPGLRANQYVPGFTEGLIGMKVGEVRKMVIPAHLGYGSQGTGPIPGDAVLVFEVTLIAIG